MRLSRRPTTTVLVFLLGAILTACAVVAPLFPWVVDRIDALMPGWDPGYGSYAFLVDPLIAEFATGDTAIQRGSVSATGVVDVALGEVDGADLDLYTFDCSSGDIEFEGVVAALLAFSTLQDPAFDDVTAFAFLGSSPDALLSSDPGTVLVLWLYVPADLRIAETCSDARYDLDLKTGWNTVVSTVDDEGVFVVETGVPPAGVSWFLDDPALRASPFSLPLRER